MSDSYATLLGLSRLLVAIWRILNLLTGLLALTMFVASFAFEPMFREFFTKGPPSIDPGLLMPTLRIWMLLALPALAIAHVMLSRLLDMIDTVRDGEPFAARNAARLKTIAWCLLALQLFHLVSGAMAATMNAAGSNIDWSFSATGWVAVALVFVLARIFEEGTRIGADLEAMI